METEHGQYLARHAMDQTMFTAKQVVSTDRQSTCTHTDWQILGLHMKIISDISIISVVQPVIHTSHAI